MLGRIGLMTCWSVCRVTVLGRTGLMSCSHVCRVTVLVMWLPPCIQDRLQNGEPDECIWEPSNNKAFVIVIAILGHHGPCITICVCYVHVFRAMRKRMSRVSDMSGNARILQRMREQASNSVAIEQRLANEKSVIGGVPGGGGGGGGGGGSGGAEAVGDNQLKRREERERRSFILLSYVIGSYLACWVPFHVVFDISAASPDSVPDVVYSMTFWLTYLNSTLNPLLYAYSSPDFRKAFTKIIKCQLKRY